jgi:hypothetical protein
MLLRCSDVLRSVPSPRAAAPADAAQHAEAEKTDTCGEATGHKEAQASEGKQAAHVRTREGGLRAAMQNTTKQVAFTIGLQPKFILQI